MENSQEKKIAWIKPEYTHQEKSNDWYWALGIIVIAGSIAAIIYSNYFFAAVLVLSGIMMGYFGGREPQDLEHEFGPKGLRIGNSFYAYERIKAFWVRKEENPKLFLRTNKILTTHLSIPIDIETADDIRNLLISQKIPEEKMDNHPAEKVMDAIGF